VEACRYLDSAHRRRLNLARRRPDFFVPTTGLFVPTTGLFALTTKLFAPTTGLFVPTTGLFLPMTGLFAPTTGLFVPTGGLLKSCASTGLVLLESCVSTESCVPPATRFYTPAIGFYAPTTKFYALTTAFFKHIYLCSTSFGDFPLTLSSPMDNSDYLCMNCVNLKILNVYCTVMGYLNTGIVAQ